MAPAMDLIVLLIVLAAIVCIVGAVYFVWRLVRPRIARIRPGWRGLVVAVVIAFLLGSLATLVFSLLPIYEFRGSITGIVMTVLFADVWYAGFGAKNKNAAKGEAPAPIIADE